MEELVLDTPEQVSQPDKAEQLLKALADYCGVRVEDVAGYVVGVEFRAGERLSFTSAWRVDPPWRLGGYLDAVRKGYDNEIGG